MIHRFERLPGDATHAEDNAAADQNATATADADADPAPASGAAAIRHEESSSSLIDGRYRLRAELGAGAMGVVYCADDVWLGRRVAVKVIREARATNGLFLEMFRTEARALAQVRHEHVVQVYAFGPHASSFYLAMEYVDGDDLAAMLLRGRVTGEVIDTERALAIIRQVGAGLGAVHARGIVHQDVKPSNIIVERETGRPVLIDFGLARGAVTVVPSTLAVGTPEYMAPEQCRASGVTARSDVYSLACTAFELLTGRPVFEGDNTAVVMAHILRVAPRLSDRHPDLASLDDVFARALAKAPSERHPTAQAFVDDLDAAAKRTHRRVKREYSLDRVAQPMMRVLVFEQDEQLRRQLVRIVDRTLRAAGDAIEIECVASAVELGAIANRSSPDIVIIDDESADGAVGPLLAMIGPDPRREVLVLRRDFDARVPASVPIRELPKPVNAQVLASVLAQMARRIVERRAPQRPAETA